MAYRTRRSPARRTSASRRSYGSSRGVTRRRTSARRSAGSSKSRGQQTLKIVVETLPATAVSRPEGGPLQTTAAPPKPSRF